MPERELVPGAVDADADRVAIDELSLEDPPRDAVLDPLLDHTLERTGTELRIIACVAQVILYVAALSIRREERRRRRW